jgi:hemerythrin
MTQTDISLTNDTNINQTWNDSYSLGIEPIDKQHAGFFDLFDKLKAMNNEDILCNKMKDSILELEKYTNIHFRTEEALLIKSNYADFDSHILQHKFFKKKIEEFKIAETYKNSVLIDQIIVFMRKWFLMHIAEIDRKYAEDVKRVLNEKNHQ